MGCGKSSVAKELAKLLSLPYIDLDDEIIAKTGQSIEEIFSEGGEAHFRDIEYQVLADILTSHDNSNDPNDTIYLFPKSPNNIKGNLIISLGGGTVTDPRSAQLIQEHTHCIWLEASEETILSHLIGKNTNNELITNEQKISSRPLLSANNGIKNLSARIKSMLEERTPIYRQAANNIVNCDNKTPLQIAQSIIVLL